MSRTALLAAALALIPAGAAAAIDIAAAGSWSRNISASDLQAGAGSDLAAEYESASSAVTLTISATGGASDAWRVDIRRVDGANWHASMALYARRTSDGTGSGTVSGGTSYQTITTTDQTFFSGAGDRSDVAIQQKLGGISVGIQPNTYATTVYYTVVDT